ncbi:hypothetical protein D3C84_1095750 [compost metagenome]
MDKRLKVDLGDTAKRAFPVIRNVLEPRAGNEAAIRVPLFFVVNQTAGAADELLPGID